MADIACALFPAAAASLPAGPCPTTPPSEESKSQISATAVAFEDPPDVKGTGTPSGGVDPANGVVTYSKSWHRTRRAPCRSSHNLCTAIVNDFVSRDGSG